MENQQWMFRIESTGVGIATMTVVGFLDIYYCVIIAWTFFYLFATYSAIPDLPWATCGNFLTLPSVVFFFLTWSFHRSVPTSACANLGFWLTVILFRGMVEYKSLLQGIWEHNREQADEGQLHCNAWAQQDNGSCWGVLGVSSQWNQIRWASQTRPYFCILTIFDRDTLGLTSSHIGTLV